MQIAKSQNRNIYNCMYLVYTVNKDGYEEKDRVGFRVSIVDHRNNNNLDCMNGTGELIVNYNIICDEGGGTWPENLSVIENMTTCDWNITIQSSLGCWQYSAINSNDNSTDNLSPGSVFLIIFIVIILTYIILGCAYNSFYHGRVGMDAVPNKDSWTQFSRYCRAGFEVTRDTICCTHSPGSYQEL